MDKQRKALYTDLDISPVKLYLQWRTLIEIHKKLCWREGGGRQKIQHRLWEQEVLSQIYIFQTPLTYVKEKGDYKFSFWEHISSHRFNCFYQSCCPLHSHFYLPQQMSNTFRVFSRFTKESFLCSPSAGAAKTLAWGKPIITYENSYTLLFILLQGLEQSINSHENELYFSPSIRQLHW